MVYRYFALSSDLEKPAAGSTAAAGKGGEWANPWVGMGSSRREKWNIENQENIQMEGGKEAAAGVEPWDPLSLPRPLRFGGSAGGGD